MRLLRLASVFWLGIVLIAAPASAAAYSWPLQVSQPVNVSNLAFSATSEAVVVCSVAVNATTPAFVEGTAGVPIRSTPSGFSSYSGNVTLNIAQPPQGGPPLAGFILTCTLREKTAGQFTNVGSASTLKLP